MGEEAGAGGGEPVQGWDWEEEDEEVVEVVHMSAETEALARSIEAGG